MSRGGSQPTPKYIDQFSKALASEVRILLAEVGKLRDERRQLQYEIAELMAVKSKHGAGGEYSPNWHPPRPPTPPEEPPPPEEPAIPPAKAAWRTVHRRPERKPRPPKGAAAPPEPPKPSPEPPKPEMPAWSTWRPNPLVAPTPRMATAQAPLPTPAPGPAGLFGPTTPPPT